MKNIIKSVQLTIISTIHPVREQVRSLSQDERRTLAHECKDVISRDRGTARVAAELVLGALSLEES